jgi:hypothetical protein
MAERTPWTVMNIICPYTLLKSEGYKGVRIAKILSKIEEYERMWTNGEINLDELEKRVCEKADGNSDSFTYTVYTEADITKKKGTYDYWLDSRYIGAQNIMNQEAARYLVFFYNALIDLEGFGKKRIKRVEEKMNSLMSEYEFNRFHLSMWEKELEEEAGLAIEMPIDPLTQTQGSIMTG